MTPADSSDQNGVANQPATSRLEDLIPIAVVVAAGCESCAESMVKRALGNGTAPALIKLTLGIVARLRSTDCFVDAVGEEAAARMDKPLAAGRGVLRAARPLADGPGCCAPAGPPVAPDSRLV
jgi:Carboxymuconolactone decarboxylase family